MDKLIPALEPDDYEKDEKQRTVTLTESGVEKIETMLRDTALMATGSLYDIHNVGLVHHVNQALRAHKLFARDTDYIVKDDKIIIIDEFTGRMMEGTALLRRAASGARGQGAGHGPEREPDARLDHLPELLPPLSEACRHDRHGDDRIARVRRYL